MEDHPALPPANLDPIAGFRGMIDACGILATPELRYEMLTQLGRKLDALAADVTAARQRAVVDAWNAHGRNASKTGRALGISHSRMNQLLAAAAKGGHAAT